MVKSWLRVALLALTGALLLPACNSSPFPSVSEVRTKVQGASPVDTVARQCAAFMALGKIVMQRSYASGRGQSLDKEDSALLSAYGSGCNESPRELREAKEFGPLLTKYQGAAFEQEMVSLFELQGALDAARAQRVTNRNTSSGSNPIVGMISIGGGGALFLALGVACLVHASGVNRKLREQRFNGFATFAEAEAYDVKRKGSNFIATLGVLLLMVGGLLLAFLAIVSSLGPRH